MNLITTPWIPVIRQDGTTQTIRPQEITSHLTDNPITALNIPRPDWRGAMTEFLIGLVQTCLPPEKERAWHKQRQNPPTPNELEAHFAPVIPAFNLLGDGPRFMQELGGLDGDTTIVQLLMDAPGDNTLRENKDLFFKRSEPQHMSQFGVAMALYTLQTYAPGGGPGYRTGVRGGGPLTTLLLSSTLWDTIWWNVCLPSTLNKDTPWHKPSKDNLHTIFPWLRPTQTSHKVNKTVPTIHPPQMHPAHVYWTMPWRLWLNDPTHHDQPIHCPWLQHPTTTTLTSFAKTNYGMNYSSLWRHPLSTYKHDTKKDELISFKSNASSLLYNQWPQHTTTNTDTDIHVSLPIQTALQNQHREKEARTLRIWCFGFDMDNAKAVCWYDGQMPIHFVDTQFTQIFAGESQACVEAANNVQYELYLAINRALFGRYSAKDGKPSWHISTSPSQKTLSETVKAQFWHDTTAQFYATIEEIAHHIGDAQHRHDAKLRWAKSLQKAAKALFTKYTAQSLDAARDIKAHIIARDHLSFNTNAKHKNLKTPLHLDIPNE